MNECQFCKSQYEPSETGAQSIGCPTCVRGMSITYDEKETVKRCADCGYQVSDLEKLLYGQVRKNDGGVVIEERNVCVFCHDPSTQPVNKVDWVRHTEFWQPSRWVEFSIQSLKVEIRQVIYDSQAGRRLRFRKNLLEIDFREQIFDQPYRSDQYGKQILNAHQIEYDKVSSDLTELKMVARLAYYDTLGRFGKSTDDTPPATRHLTYKQKVDLAKGLKDRLRTLKTCRASGFYD